jgi:threonine synthase
MTPLIRSYNTEKQFNLKKVYIKNDGMNPSASFKDRASAIGMMKALEKKKKIITGASTGNAASSLACLTASTDLETIIFVPKAAPTAKIAQLLVFGARVFTVNGTYDDAFDLCMNVTKEWGWYNRNTGINPYLSEGKKTCSLEIAEQLNWKTPDYLFVSVGDGCIIGGIHKGFTDLFNMGFINKIPKLIAVQASGSAGVFNALQSKEKIIKPVIADTIADSISVNLPRDGYKAIRAVTETKGFAITVTDQEIIKAIPDLARDCSVFAEPAGAAAYAGLDKAVKNNLISHDSEVVCIITGNGLKDISSAMKSVKKPTPVSAGEAGLNELKKLFS